MKHRPELDGLRAVAIGLVTLEHVLPHQFPGGFIGVDIFFVLSGYLITSLLLEESAQDNRISLRRFYYRRLLRLAPALVLMLGLFTALFIAYAVLRHKIDFAESQLWGGAAAISYLQDWNLALDIRPRGFFEHTWSLAVEEQFYLIWPVVLIIASRWGRTALIVQCIVLLIICNVWRAHLWADGSAPIRIYAGFDTRFDNLLIGCLLALVPIPSPFRKAMAKYVWLPLVAMLVITLSLEWNSSAYQLGMIIPCLFAAWILVAVLTDPDSQLSKTMQFRPVNYVGRISYGYYLWHFPVFLTLAWVIHDRPVALAALTIAISLGVASISYHWLELPIRKLGRN